MKIVILLVLVVVALILLSVISNMPNRRFFLLGAAGLITTFYFYFNISFTPLKSMTNALLFLCIFISAVFVVFGISVEIIHQHKKHLYKKEKKKQAYIFEHRHEHFFNFDLKEDQIKQIASF